MKTYMVTSHDFSWLQNGQLNCLSSGTIAFLFGGGFDFFFLLPILEVSVPDNHQLNNPEDLSFKLTLCGNIFLKHTFHAAQSKLESRSRVPK